MLRRLAGMVDRRLVAEARATPRQMPEVTEKQKTSPVRQGARTRAARRRVTFGQRGRSGQNRWQHAWSLSRKWHGGGRGSRGDWHAADRRLVATGNQERQEVRRDSPTADTEGAHLVSQFRELSEGEGAVRTLGERVLLGRVNCPASCCSGLPGLKPSGRLSARVLVHGTLQDEGSGRSSAAHCLVGTSGSTEFCEQSTL